MSQFTVNVLKTIEGLGKNILSSTPVLGAFFNNGYRPPQWQGPQLTSITANFPVSSSSTEEVQHTINTGAGVDTALPTTNTRTSVSSTPSTFFFDAILRLDHEQELRSTDHPIQNGASITDHAYLLQARVGLEIGMSDAMDSYKAGQFTGDPSKSVSAYQTLLDLQQRRIPLTVTTRLRTYTNMVIENIRTTDDNRTRWGLRAHVQFKQIIFATVAQLQNAQSSRPDQSTDSKLGTSQPEAVPQELQKFMVPFPGTGGWSSNVPTGGGS